MADSTVNDLDLKRIEDAKSCHSQIGLLLTVIHEAEEVASFARKRSSVPDSDFAKLQSLVDQLKPKVRELEQLVYNIEMENNLPL